MSVASLRKASCIGQWLNIDPAEQHVVVTSGKVEIGQRIDRALRGIVLVAPFLPWLRWREGMRLMRFVDPRWAERLPLEKAWPLLKRTAEAIEGTSPAARLFADHSFLPPIIDVDPVDNEAPVID